MTLEVDYDPSPWQQRYHASTEHEVLGAGAAGPGKTTALSRDILSRVLLEHERCADTHHPHYHPWGYSKGSALYLRRTFKRLEQTEAKIRRFYMQVDTGAKWNANDHILTFSSGYRLQMGHCENPDDWENYFSNEYDWIGFDELVEFLEEQYTQIIRRCRSEDPLLAGMLKRRAMSNPLMRRERDMNFVMRDPHWVRRRFVDPWPGGNRTIRKKLKRKDGTTAWRTRRYMPATLFDNPNKEFVEQYELELLDAPPHIRAAMLYGDWYATPDGFYAQCWDRDIHVVKPFAIPWHWPRFRAMDWGFKSGANIGWYAIDDDENIWKTDEVPFSGLSPQEVVEKIVRPKEKRLGLWDDKKNKSRITGPADTQLWEQRGETTKSKAETFRQMGVPWEPANKKNRAGNAELLLYRLNDHRGRTTTPGFVCFSTCTKTISTLPGIGTDPNKNPPEPSTGGDDHAHDETLYAVAYGSRGRAGIRWSRKKDDPWSDEVWKIPEKPAKHGYSFGMGDPLSGR